jgi:hypothetical protein
LRRFINKLVLEEELEYLIQGDAAMRDEAVEAAICTMDARIRFWDGVREILPSKRVAASTR